MEMARDRILNLKALQLLVPWSRATFYRQEQLGLFPKRKKLGERSCGWLESEVQRWIKEKMQPEQTQPDDGGLVVAKKTKTKKRKTKC